MAMRPANKFARAEVLGRTNPSVTLESLLANSGKRFAWRLWCRGAGGDAAAHQVREKIGGGPISWHG
jgi:hypothetical protein